MVEPKRSRLGPQILLGLGAGVVICGSGFLKGGIEGFRQGREESSEKFGANLAVRVETLLRTRDDARLARASDQDSVALVRRGRERAERLCGPEAKAEFVRTIDQNRFRYSRAERYFEGEVRLTGPHGRALARVRCVRDEARSKWSLSRFDVERLPPNGASQPGSSP